MMKPCTAINPTSGSPCRYERLRRKDLCAEHLRRLLRPGALTPIQSILSVQYEILPKARKAQLLERAEERADRLAKAANKPSAAYTAIRDAASKLPYQPEEFSGRSY